VAAGRNIVAKGLVRSSAGSIRRDRVRRVKIASIVANIATAVRSRRGNIILVVKAGRGILRADRFLPVSVRAVMRRCRQRLRGRQRAGIRWTAF
jgi:hypothetical protein